jgi:hypothetical protein
MSLIQEMQSAEYFDVDIPVLDGLNKSFVQNIICELKNNPVPKNDPTNYVLRDRRHTISWFINYIRTELESLDEEFVTTTKYYECKLLVERRYLFLKFSFYLKTHGLEGHTEYFIVVRKNGEDFACLE